MRGKTRMTLVNKTTGEQMNVLVYLFSGREKKDKDFVKVFYAFLDDVLLDRDIMAGPFRLLAYIMSQKLDKDSLDFHLTMKETTEKLGVTEQTFYRWLSILQKKGYIKRVSANYYVLRPYTAVIGTMANVEIDP